MTVVFAILSVQALLGAFDNLWHHELEARLPQRVSARYELALHTAREAIYGVLFLALAWCQCQGAWAWVLAALLAAEVFITLADFIEEDLTRRLPPLERVLHTILAMSYGAFVVALAPTVLHWAALPTRLAFGGHGWVSWLFTAYAAGVLAWSVRNGMATVKLHRLASRIRPAAPLRAPSGPAILVTGGTGFIGAALVESLLGAGKRVIVLTRDTRQAQAAFGQRVHCVDTLDAIPAETPIDAVVNLAGAPILGGWWTARRRQTLLRSRTETTGAVVALMRRLAQPPRVLVSASASGFYGVRQDAAELDECAPPQPGTFQSDLCAAWEHEARRAAALGIRVVRLRFGVVLGQGGGIYPPLGLAARLGLGAILGSGRQKVAWVHRDDAVGLIRFALDRDGMAGAVNAVAPDTMSQAIFVRTLAGMSGRQVRLRVPAALLRFGLGAAATLLLDGQNATPRAALAQGYRFRHPTLAGAAVSLRAGQRPIDGAFGMPAGRRGAV